MSLDLSTLRGSRVYVLTRCRACRRFYDVLLLNHEVQRQPRVPPCVPTQISSQVEQDQRAPDLVDAELQSPESQQEEDAAEEGGSKLTVTTSSCSAGAEATITFHAFSSTFARRRIYLVPATALA